MGAVIPDSKRGAVGQFLDQGGYLPEWVTPLNPPEKGRGGDDAPGSSGGGEIFFRPRSCPSDSRQNFLGGRDRKSENLLNRLNHQSLCCYSSQTSLWDLQFHI